MRLALDLGGLVLSAEAVAPAEPVAGGVILRGDRVRLTAPVPVTRFYRHGWQSWSPTRWLDATRPVAHVPVPELRLAADDPVYALCERHGGSGVGAVDCGEGRVLLLGALGLGGRVEALTDALEAAAEGPPVEWFAALGTEQRVFARYAELLGDRLGRRTRPAPRMWSSWYSLYRDISEPRLRQVLDQLAGFAIDVFQVDDGWQQAIGDWEANAEFPSGMEALAASVRNAGFEPGLWMAPFIAGEHSRLAREHPEFLIGADDGSGPAVAGYNWGGHYFGLDLTHPGAREYVGDLIDTAVGWGYGFLKLDFLFAAALPGRRHQSVPREAAYRRGAELVRRAAGEDTYLLACGAPVIASLGIFDGIRVGPDVAPWWEQLSVTRYLHDLAGASTRYAIATSLHRLWLQPVIDTDPDVAYFGSRGNCLTPRQREWLQALARIANFRATSNLPDALAPDERETLARFFTSTPRVRRLGRYRFDVDGREVDFTAVAAAEPDFR